MATIFTNNIGKNLKVRFSEIIPYCKEIKILVGYFYFSAIPELWEQLKNNSDVVLKILVGIDGTDIEALQNSIIKSRENRDEIKRSYLKELNKLQNDEFDSQHFAEVLGFMIKKIENNTLIIRKTKERTHAKLYLFDFKDEYKLPLGSTFITGSSNFTLPGLTSQNEFNVEIPSSSQESYEYVEANNFFESLWENSVEITENDELKKLIIEKLLHQTPVAKITPYEAYLKILQVYLHSFMPQDKEADIVAQILAKKNYIPYQFQIDAILYAKKILQEFNGVLLADVVGLGKTITACAVARILNKSGIVICPPGLVGPESEDFGWKKYLRDFELSATWKAFSYGNLEEVKKFVDNHKVDIVIIDEAHKFRNEDTSTYELLNFICANRQVMLLTATPYNNNIHDIFALLKLFDTPLKSKLTLNKNLYGVYESLIKRYRKVKEQEKNFKKEKSSDYLKLNTINSEYKEILIEIRNLVESVIIRRNRLDLLKNPRYKNEISSLSKVSDPEIVLYELNRNVSKFYDEVLRIFLDAIKRETENYEIIDDLNEDDLYGSDGVSIAQINFYENIIDSDDNVRYTGLGDVRNISINGDNEQNTLILPELNNNLKITGAIYKPADYLKDKYKPENIIIDDSKNFTADDRENSLPFRYYDYTLQSSLFKLLIRILVKRFESSFAAFRKTLVSFKRANEIYLEFFEKHNVYVMERQFIEKFYQEDDSDLVLKKFEEFIDEKKTNIKPIKEEYYKKELFVENYSDYIKNDIEFYDYLIRKVDEMKLVENDPKVNKLIEIIKKIDFNSKPKRKILIFTEFQDTLEYVGDVLKREFNDRVLLVKDLNKKILDDINYNFDASVPDEKQRDDYDILLATDKLAEGFNLNRCGILINYDIPWNPVKVIQRLGRINRISKKVFDELYVYNFFPTEQGDDIIRLVGIAKRKMFAIHNILGEDSKILSPDENPTPAQLYKNFTKNITEFEEESFYTKIYNIYTNAINENPELKSKLERMPKLVKVAKEHKEFNNIISVIQRERLHIKYLDKEYFGDRKKEQIKEISFEEILKFIECDKDTKAVELSERFWNNYVMIKDSLQRREKVNFEIGPKSSLKKAKDAVNKLHNRIHQEFNSKKEIIEVLKKDLDNYLKLSKFTLRRLGKIYNVMMDFKGDELSAEAIDEINKILSEIENLMTKEYLSMLKEQGKKDEEKSAKVIITVENVKIGGGDERLM